MQQTLRNEKALYLEPNANPGHVEGNDRNTNPHQEGGVTMTSIVPHPSDNFDTAIMVAGRTVAPGVMTGGTKPDESVVTLTTRDELLSFTPAEACALAAALSAVAVHLMEQEGRELHRRTKPGAPAFEEGV